MVLLFVLTCGNCPACSQEYGGWRKKMAEEYKGEAYCVKCKEKRAFEGHVNLMVMAVLIPLHKLGIR